MIKKLFLLLFALSTVVCGFAQSNIKLHFPGAENKTAHVWAYSDFVSFSKMELSTVEIDKKGNFEFKLVLKQAIPIFIQVNYIRIQLYIEPNQDYEIEIDAVDFENEEFYPKTVIGYLSPKFRIVKPTDKELNRGLEDCNNMFSAFIDSNYLSLIRGQNTDILVDSFRYRVSSFTKQYGNEYLDSYAKFQMIQLRLLSHEYSTQMVVDSFFTGKKLNLHDPMAMEFFNGFWSNYLLNKAKGFTIYQLDSVINIQKSYQALSALLTNDPLLQDNVLRELVIIRNLQQLYSNRQFDKKAIIHLLYDISRTKLRKEHQQIAVNVRKRLTSYERGSKVKDFNFTDINGQKIKLSDFEGMYVYISIWDINCPECLAEMEYTKELYEEFDDIIKFISISVDADPEAMKAYVKSRDLPWTFCSLGENYQFLNDYNIVVLPRYILIDKDGKMELMKAPNPSNHFADYFLKMLNDKKGNLQLKNR